MQASKFIRFFALALFFLFPLLSVMQLRDTDGPWRQVAEEIRPSVVTLQPASGTGILGCGLIIQGSPLRMVTVGAPHPGKVISYLQGERVEWSPIFVDVEEQFTILQAASDLQAETAGAGSMVHTATATVLDLEGAGVLPEGVKAALVGPRTLDAEALWVGVLRSASSPSGRAQYLGSLMRRVNEVAGFATTDAWAEDSAEIASVLHGAPFVDAKGRIVGLYLGRDGHRVRALPIEQVSRSFVLLHLQAAQ